jgi:hypothetical protein
LADATKVAVGAPAQVGSFGQLNIAIFVENGNATSPLTLVGGLPDFSNWTQSTTLLHTINSVPGQVNSVNVTLGNGAAGTAAEIEVVAWSGADTTWGAATLDGSLLAFSGGGDSPAGTLGWLNATGTTTSPAALLVGTSGGYQGLVLAPLVPEPSTIALGGMAAAALLAFRRKK